MRGVSKQQFVERLHSKFPFLDVKDDYVNMSTKCTFYCHNCHRLSVTHPLYVLSSKYGCPKCGHEKNAARQPYSNDVFLSKLKKVTDKIAPLESYRGRHVKILFQCNVCGNKWKAQPNNILSGKGCPVCACKKIAEAKVIGEDSTLKEIHLVNSSIKVLDHFYKRMDKIHVKCLVCGNVWMTTSQALIQNHGCPSCAQRIIANKEALTTDEINRRIHLVNSDISLNEEYVSPVNHNNDLSYEFKCSECGYVWRRRISNMLKDPHCPNCVHKQKGSIGENVIKSILNQVGVEYYSPFIPGGTCRYQGNLHYDFIVGRHWLIEYQGQQHYEPEPTWKGVSYEDAVDEFHIQQKRDSIKATWAKKHGYKLLCIKYGSNIYNSLLPTLLEVQKSGETKLDPRLVIQHLKKVHRQVTHRLNTGDFIEQLSDKFPNVKLTGAFINMSTETEFTCRVCHYTWIEQPKVVLISKYGCPACARHVNTKSDDEFVKELNEKQPMISVLESYKNGTTKLRFKCLRCGTIYTTLPNEALKGKWGGCPSCSRKAISKTNDTFVLQLKKKFSTIVCLDKYRGSFTKIHFKCLKCGHVWLTMPATILASKYGCPVCSHRFEVAYLRKPSNQFLRELHKKTYTIECLDEYQGALHKIRFRCLACGCVFSNTPSQVLRNEEPCPNCRKQKLLGKRKSVFVHKLQKKHPNLKLIGNYVNQSTKVDFKCTSCGKVFKSAPGNILAVKISPCKCGL